MLEAALCDVDSCDPVNISSIFDQYCEQPSLKEQSVYNRLDVIDRCFFKKTVEEILSALEREVVHQMDGWISATIQTLKKVSPTSLKISLRSIREGRLQGLGPCLAVSIEWFVMSCGENSVKTFLRVAGLHGYATG